MRKRRLLFPSRVRAKYNQKAAKIQSTELILSSERTIVLFLWYMRFVFSPSGQLGGCCGKTKLLCKTYKLEIGLAQCKRTVILGRIPGFERKLPAVQS